MPQLQKTGPFRVLVPVSLISDPAKFGGTKINDCLAGELILKNSRLVGLKASAAPVTRIVMPRFTDPHVHLAPLQPLAQKDIRRVVQTANVQQMA